MLLSRPCRTTRLWSTGSGQKGSKKGLGQKPFLSSQAILAQKPCGQARVGDPHGLRDLNPCGLEVSEEEGGGVGYEGILWDPGGRGDALVGGGPS